MIKSMPMKSVIKNIPVEIAVILGLFLVFFILFFVTARTGEEKVVIHYLSTNETGVYGASRMLTLAERSNINVDKFTLNIIGDIPEDAGLIFLLSPEIELTTAESNSLVDWIESGGTLVYSDNIRHLIDHSFSNEEEYSLEDRFLDKYEIYSSASIVSDDETPVVMGASEDNDGISLTEVNLESDDIMFRDVKRILTPLFFKDKSLKRLSFSTFYLPETESSEDDGFTPDWTILAFENKKPLIISIESGEGRIIAVANPLIFSNGFIEFGDNIMFAYNLMNSIPDGKAVLFDEYHHGFSTVEEKRVLETGWGRAIAMMLIAGIVAIYSKAVRFIPPRAVPPPERRSQVEYLKSMAQILRKAKALKVVSRIMLRDFRSAKVRNDEAKNLESMLVDEASKKRPSESRIYSTIIKMMGLEKR